LTFDGDVSPQSLRCARGPSSARRQLVAFLTVVVGRATDPFSRLHH